MSSDELPPYILQELPDITAILNLPLAATQRIKYTCFDVSPDYLAIGATSGGIYMFNRDPCEFMQLLPNKDGAITKVSISPNQKYVAFASAKGTVSVIQCNGEAQTHSQISKEHQGREVTAIAWTESPLSVYIGDDVGKVSVLQLSNFITKKMFTSTSSTIMSLDSRIKQLDAIGCMLLVSTLTKTFICHTSREMYRQIGQQLRDGEYGACFMYNSKPETEATNEDLPSSEPDKIESKAYNVITNGERFTDGDKYSHVKIYCGRPKCRIWEADIDGTVLRTHQFKHKVCRTPSLVITEEMLEQEDFDMKEIESVCDAQNVTVSKLNTFAKYYIVTYRRDALYLLNTINVDHTMWSNKYGNILDCKVVHNCIYLWLRDGNFVILSLMKIEKFLISCFLNNKFLLCVKLCALHLKHLSEVAKTYFKLHLLASLRDKLVDREDLLKSIEPLLDELGKLKMETALQLKSGIFVVDNSHFIQTTLDETQDDGEFDNLYDDDNNFLPISAETLQSLKELSLSVTGKFNSGTKRLKEKWDDLEDKMRKKSSDRNMVFDVGISEVNGDSCDDSLATHELDNNPVLFNDSNIPSQETQDKHIDNNLSNRENSIRCLYQLYKLNANTKTSDYDNICKVIDDAVCNLVDILDVLKNLNEYLRTINVSDIEILKISHNIFLVYINKSNKFENALDFVVKDENLCTYFVEACIGVNIRYHKGKNLGCECGYPLPDLQNYSSQTPLYHKLINTFIEKQWSSQAMNNCYNICNKMPYMWRKILYLRRKEDLKDILMLILQMLDEKLLYSFLPQFTIETWEKAVTLYATLLTDCCLNCGKKFPNISVKKFISWDAIGALMIKSVGSKNATKIMEKHSDCIDHPGGLTFKFYHTALLVALLEKFDGTLRTRLCDTLFDAHGYEEARVEICRLLGRYSQGIADHTALPLIVAIKSKHWGLGIPNTNLSVPIDTIDGANVSLTDLKDNNFSNTDTDSYNSVEENPKMTDVSELKFCDVLGSLNDIYRSRNLSVDCTLCGLPLVNDILIKEGNLWVFSCGHTFHGTCLSFAKLKLCPSC